MNKYPDSDEEFEQPIDFLGIFIRYITFWKWFVVSLIICVLLAIVYLKFTLPEYEATT
jgi:tyrosine-protein kinase Etk/Wzc